ncbi:MAG: cobyrinate a,c-diamide synthase [Ktedonobacteraceae bacterium]
MLLTLPRIVFAGVSSSVGKTTMTAAFIAHVRTHGVAIQPFKVGPDYIDPSHLALAAGQPCYNLDTWMMPPSRMLDVFCTVAASANIAVIEGVMGLYDGQSSTSNAGSTAEVAKLLQAPVVLVIDAGAMARSAAAVVMGFQHLDPEVHIVGVIANRVGGTGHARLLQEAIEAETGLPLLGYMRNAPDKLVPERHLGLVPAAERIVSAQQLTALGQQFSQTCDGEKLLALARAVPPIEYSGKDPFFSMETMSEPVRIAIAQDEAFNFYYPDTLRLLRLAGAQLVPFSPLHENMLPEDIAGIYIGGGFPEEYAHRLSANARMRAALARLLRKDLPCYAECGGFMYLCQSIRNASGEELPMVGAIARQSVMSNDRSGLVIGYREATTLRDTLLMRQGEMVRGHEFHYSRLNAPLAREEAAYEFTTRGQVEGFAQGNLLASYLHLSFSGFPLAARRFVTAAKAWLVHSGGQ